MKILYIAHVDHSIWLAEEEREAITTWHDMVNLQKTSQDSGGLDLLVAGNKEMLGRVLLGVLKRHRFTDRIRPMKKLGMSSKANLPINFSSLTLVTHLSFPLFPPHVSLS